MFSNRPGYQNYIKQPGLRLQLCTPYKAALAVSFSFLSNLMELYNRAKDPDFDDDLAAFSLSDAFVYFGIPAPPHRIRNATLFPRLT